VVAEANTFLLGGGVEFLGWRGGALGAAFLFYVLRAVGNFVVHLFDFESQVKILGMLGILFE
jgi:hypothetical protein